MAESKKSEGKRANDDGSGAWRNRDTSFSGTVDGAAARTESLLERRRFVKELTAREHWKSIALAPESINLLKSSRTSTGKCRSKEETAPCHQSIHEAASHWQAATVSMAETQEGEKETGRFLLSAVPSCESEGIVGGINHGAEKEVEEVR